MWITKTHEWIRRVSDSTVRLGMTKKGTEQLGEVVWIDLPKVGDTLVRDELLVVLESTKAAIDLYSPLSGRVLSCNEKLQQQPNLLKEDPEGEGWIIELLMEREEELLQLT